MMVLIVPSEHAQLAVRPFDRADAQDDVGGKQRAEQHHFRREEQPDPELAVGQSGVGPFFDCVRNIHRVTPSRLPARTAA